jgi:hypothetical protein
MNNNSHGNLRNDYEQHPNRASHAHSETASATDEQVALLTETNIRLKKKLMDMVKALDQSQKMGGSNLGSVNNEK